MNKPVLPPGKTVPGVFNTGELNSEFDEQFFILNYGTRLLTAFTDRDILINIALETLADFSRGKSVAVLCLDDRQENLVVEGIFSDAKPFHPGVSLPVAGTILEKILRQKAVVVTPLVLENGVPLPAEEMSKGTDLCLCLPLVGTSFHLLGMATIAVSVDHDLSFIETQQLRILSTMLAVSLENVRLFARLIQDNLTGLYTRRFYEIRIEEALARINRDCGFLSIILFDLDDFKKVNDSFGHLMGDVVLRQFGSLLLEHVRKGSTIISRYGGEEFVLLMPAAQLAEAVGLANRLRALCADHVFGDGDHPIPMTVSGGVAGTDHTESLSPRDLFQRADQALYLAKQEGRNRVVSWSE